MIGVMVTYTVKPDRVEENERLVRAVYEELAAAGPDDVHYATFKRDDGRTFVHLAFFPSPEAQQQLGALPAFHAFQRDIADRCDMPPAPAPLEKVGAWNLGLPG